MSSAFIVPIGKVDRALLENMADFLKERLKEAFDIKQSMEVPRDALNLRRNQYSSSYILNKLIKYKGKKVLGIVDKDLYTEGLNFVFGQAESPRRCALISITRLRQEFYGLPKDDRLFFDRVTKEAVHELGHTYGIGHCSNKNCVMFFSNSIIDTDNRSTSFCKLCLERI